MNMINFNTTWKNEEGPDTVTFSMSGENCLLVITRNGLEIINKNISSAGHYFGDGYEWFSFNEQINDHTLEIKSVNNDQLLLGLNPSNVVVGQHDKTYTLERFN
jgi:hypothetical protein